MSAYDVGRLVVAVMLAYSYVVSTLLWLAADRMPYTYVLAGWRLPPVRLLAPALVGVGVHVGMCAWWYLGGSAWAEAGVLAMLWLVREVHKRTWDSDVVVELGRYVPFGTALFFHLVGSAVAPTADPVLADRFGWEAACGALAASMGLNGVTKLTMAGWRWGTVSGLNLMLAERSVFGPAPLRRLRRSLAGNRRVTIALGMLGVILEIVGMLFAVPALRWWVTAGLVATVIGIEVLLGYFEPEWMFVYPVLAVITVPIG